MGRLLSERDERRLKPVVREFERGIAQRVVQPSQSPRQVGKGVIAKLAVTNVDIVADGSGLVTIWDDSVTPPVATTETETAVLDWLHGGEEIKSGTQVIIIKFGDIWRILREYEEKPNGFFNCCICENPELYVTIEGDGITWDHVRNNLWPVKSSGGLLHKIILTSDDDPAVTREIELPLVDCADVDCHIQDMTGEFVGAREIESIIFGNSATCSVFCDPAPAISYLEETFAALPTAPWSTSLSESSVASNIMTFTARDSFNADFKPKVAAQVFHMLLRFRVLSDTLYVSLNGSELSFSDDGSWYSGGGAGSVVTGIGTPGATVELLIVDNVVTIDGSPAQNLNAGTLSGSCGTTITATFNTQSIGGFAPAIGTDIAEIDVLEIGWR